MHPPKTRCTLKTPSRAQQCVSGLLLPSPFVLLLACLQLLQALILGLLQLSFNLLLSFFLLLQKLFFVLLFHSAFRKGLVTHEAAIHALHRHLPWTTGLLDTIAVILVGLIVTCVILRLRHEYEITIICRVIQ